MIHAGLVFFLYEMLTKYRLEVYSQSEALIGSFGAQPTVHHTRYRQRSCIKLLRMKTFAVGCTWQFTRQYTLYLFVVCVR